MMTLLRRFLVLAALLFWQGGFVFYASVVVPVGQEVLGSHRRQGSITQQVTNYLNLAGLAALVPLAWDAAARDPSPGRRRLRWAAWAGMAVALTILAWLHLRLDELLDDNHVAFRAMHRWYLWISTLQWGLGVAYMVVMLCGWQAEDAAQAPERQPGESGETEGSVVTSYGVAQSPKSSGDGS